MSNFSLDRFLICDLTGVQTTQHPLHRLAYIDTLRCVKQYPVVDKRYKRTVDRACNQKHGNASDPAYAAYSSQSREGYQSTYNIRYKTGQKNIPNVITPAYTKHTMDPPQ